MKKALIITADDWEGVYVDGVLIREGHHLPEGIHYLKWSFDFIKQHDIGVVEVRDVSDFEKLDDFVQDYGGFPDKIVEYLG